MKKYLIHILTLLIICLSLTASFNYIIAGKRGLRTEFLLGPDAGSIKKRIIAAQNNNTKTLYAHSSRAISFELDQGLTNYFNGEFIKLALPGVDIHNLTSCAMQVGDGANLERIIIGLDFYAFNKNWHFALNDVCSKNSLRRQLAKRLTFLQVSLENIFWLIGKTFPEKTMLGQKTFADAGIDLLDKARLELEDFYKTKGIKDIVDRYRVNQEYYFPKYTWFPGANREYSFGKSFRNLEDLLKYAKSKNIKVYGFISPVHARLQESLIASGLEPEYLEWQENLVEIFSKYQGAELWDFADYNSVTTEQRPKLGSQHQTMRYYNDMSHHTTEVGQMILYKILNVPGKSLPVDFGKIIDKTNLKQVVFDYKEAQKKYRAKYPEEYQEVLDVVKYAKAYPKWQFDLSSKK